MRGLAFRLAARVYRVAIRVTANRWPRGAENALVSTFDELQREAWRDGQLRGVLAYWCREAASIVRVLLPSSERPSDEHDGSTSAPRTFGTSIGRDLRDGWRALRRTPGYSLACVALLALGIGANTAIFSITDALLFKSLPFADADRLVLAVEWPTTGGNWTVAPTMFAFWKKTARSFTGLEARLSRNAAFVDSGDPEDVRSAAVTTGWFDLLGIHAALGRTFQPGDASPGAGCAAIIAHGIFERRFGGDAAALGRLVRVSGQPCTIAGVLPPNAAFDHGAPEVYVPMMLTPAEAASEGRQLTVLGRLHDDVSVGAASAELAGLAASYNATRGAAGRNWTAVAYPYRSVIVRAASRQLVWVLFAAVAAVLIVACANLAGLSLSRSFERRREFAVRAALGAGRGRLFRTLLTESLLLGAVGGVVSVGIGQLALRALLALMPAGTLPPEAAATLDGRALAFTALVAIATSVLIGAVPAWRAGRVTLTEALGSTSRGSTTSRHTAWLQSGLLVVELALTLVLITGAALLVVSFVKLAGVGPGFAADGVLTLRVSAATGRETSDREIAAFQSRVDDAIQALPNVRVAGGVTSLPLGGWVYGTPFVVDGAPATDHPRSAHLQTVTPGYFDALGIAFLEGRAFTDRDDARGEPVAIVNETIARRFAPSGRLVGRALRLDSSAGGASPACRIVGVIRNVKTYSLADADLATPEIYVPEAQEPAPTLYYAVRAARGDPRALVGGIRAAIRAIDAGATVGDAMTMNERLGESLRVERFRTIVIASFALLAAVLACLGVYAVRSRAVAARTREMGIRLALGASRAQVIALSLGQGARLAAIGLTAGVAASLLLTHYISAWLFDTGAADPRILISAALALGLATTLASWVPARRAASVEPLTILREQ